MPNDEKIKGYLADDSVDKDTQIDNVARELNTDLDSAESYIADLRARDTTTTPEQVSAYKMTDEDKANFGKIKDVQSLYQNVFGSDEDAQVQAKMIKLSNGEMLPEFKNASSKMERLMLYYAKQQGIDARVDGNGQFLMRNADGSETSIEDFSQEEGLGAKAWRTVKENPAAIATAIGGLAYGAYKFRKGGTKELAQAGQRFVDQINKLSRKQKLARVGTMAGGGFVAGFGESTVDTLVAAHRLGVKFKDTEWFSNAVKDGAINSLVGSLGFAGHLGGSAALKKMVHTKSGQAVIRGFRRFGDYVSRAVKSDLTEDQITDTAFEIFKNTDLEPSDIRKIAEEYKLFTGSKKELKKELGKRVFEASDTPMLKDAKEHLYAGSRKIAQKVAQEGKNRYNAIKGLVSDKLKNKDSTGALNELGDAVTNLNDDINTGINTSLAKLSKKAGADVIAKFKPNLLNGIRKSLDGLFEANEFPAFSEGIKTFLDKTKGGRVRVDDAVEARSLLQDVVNAMGKPKSTTELKKLQFYEKSIAQLDSTVRTHLGGNKKLYNDYLNAKKEWFHLKNVTNNEAIKIAKNVEGTRDYDALADKLLDLAKFTRNPSSGAAQVDFKYVFDQIGKSEGGSQARNLAEQAVLNKLIDKNSVQAGEGFVTNFIQLNEQMKDLGKNVFTKPTSRQIKRNIEINANLMYNDVNLKAAVEAAGSKGGGIVPEGAKAVFYNSMLGVYNLAHTILGDVGFGKDLHGYAIASQLKKFYKDPTNDTLQKTMISMLGGRKNPAVQEAVKNYAIEFVKSGAGDDVIDLYVNKSARMVKSDVYDKATKSFGYLAEAGAAVKGKKKVSVDADSIAVLTDFIPKDVQRKFQNNPPALIKAFLEGKAGVDKDTVRDIMGSFESSGMIGFTLGYGSAYLFRDKFMD